MELKALNLNYNTKPSIIYIAGCAVVLMPTQRNCVRLVALNNK